MRKTISTINLSSNGRPNRIGPRGRGHRQEGYALISLLFLMTIMLLLMMEAAPRIQQQTQREREIEAIYRGEQVAEAIRLYMRYRRALPTSMSDLLEGVPYGTKKIQLLRASAARDPLSESGEWRLIAIDHPALASFQQAVAVYAGGALPPTRDDLLSGYTMHLQSLAGVRANTSLAENDTSSSAGPFIGVASSSTRKSILNYYGIDQHNRWIFTPLFR